MSHMKKKGNVDLNNLRKENVFPSSPSLKNKTKTITENKAINTVNAKRTYLFVTIFRFYIKPAN